MKRWLLIILALTMLTACEKSEITPQHVGFYYPRREIVYGAQDGVIALDSREISLDGSSLYDLLNMYLQGPADTDLISPFPPGASILEIAQRDNCLHLTMNNDFFTPDSLNSSLSRASLAKTCFSLTDCEIITLHSSDRDTVLTITRNTFVLSDDGDNINMTIGTEPVTP